MFKQSCLNPSNGLRVCLHKDRFHETHIEDTPVVSHMPHDKVGKRSLLQKMRRLMTEKKTRLTGDRRIVGHIPQSFILSPGGLLVDQLQLGKS